MLPINYRDIIKNVRCIRCTLTETLQDAEGTLEIFLKTVDNF